MDFLFILYLFLSIVTIFFFTARFSNSGRPLSAFLTFIFLLLIFTFFYTRWFKGTNAKNDFQGQWPPVINPCPDYLVYYKRSGEESCIDLVGVSRNPGLQPWIRNETPENPPSASNKYFRNVYKTGMGADDMKKLGEAALLLNLTWEGITNGYSLTFDTSAVDQTQTCGGPPVQKTIQGVAGNTPTSSSGSSTSSSGSFASAIN